MRSFVFVVKSCFTKFRQVVSRRNK